MRNTSTVIAILAVGSILSSCSTFKYSNPIGQKPLQVTVASESDFLRNLGNRKGLALSGGGIRSAYFSMGVMKALYDAGQLQKIDALSTVSGGGYAAYWLITEQQANDSSGTEFGALLLSDSNFPVTLCKIMAHANFVKTTDAAKAAVKGSSLSLYHNAIGRSFGFADINAKMTLRSLKPKTASGELPYWIINATKFQNGMTLDQDGIFEFSPLLSGSVKDGYGAWNDWSMSLRRAVSVSGAAANGLKQLIPNPARADTDSKIWLWDGGYSENLAAYSLIKRGTKEVIVVDAEHDPDLSSAALSKVERLLKKDGYNVDISLPKKENGRLKRSYSIGHAIDPNTSRRTEISYLKMSLPKSLDTLVNDSRLLKLGKEMQSDFMAKIDQTKRRGNWDCEKMKGHDTKLKPWMVYSLAGYSKYVNEENYSRHFRNFPWQLVRTGFPQYTTIDTSYYTDQAKAFVALGYLQGSELFAGKGKQAVY